MSQEYLAEVNRAYNHYFFHYTLTPLLVVNTSEMDFVEAAGGRGRSAEADPRHGEGHAVLRAAGKQGLTMGAGAHAHSEPLTSGSRVVHAFRGFIHGVGIRIRIASALDRIRRRAAVGRVVARGRHPPRGRPSGPPHPDREPLRAPLLPAPPRHRPPAPAPHVPARAAGGGARGGAQPAPHQPQRGRRRAPVHERQPAPGAQGPARAAAAAHRRARPRPEAGLRGAERPLLRRQAARAPHLGPRERAGAARRPHLRQLRSRARPHPHPSRAGPPRRPHVLPGERRVPRDAAPPHGRDPRPRRAAPSTIRARSARPRCSTPCTVRPWPGRRRTFRRLLRASHALDRKRKAQAAALRNT